MLDRGSGPRPPLYGSRTPPYDVAVCTDDSPASLAAAVRHDVEPAIEIDLEPVDSVAVLTLMDNVTDNLMADQEPARRADCGARGARWR